MMTVPDTGETVNMTNNGTGFISPVPWYTDTVSASGREYVFSEDDDDISAITFHEIIRYNPETFEGNGLVIAVFDKSATGSLVPFNGMMAFVAQNIERKERGDEMIDELTFSQRGHTILLGKESLGILSGLLVTGRMCDYTEDSIVDNFIIEVKNKEKGISAKALKASENVESIEEFPLAFNFVTYATSKAFLDLLGYNNKYSADERGSL